MGYERISSGIGDFERICDKLSIEVPASSPVGRSIVLVKEFIADMQRDAETAVQKWTKRPFDEWYWSMLSVEKLCSAVSVLEDHCDDLKELVPLAIAQEIKQDFEPTQAKTYLYELQIGAWCQQAGFSVTFQEPDVRISGNGLSQQIGFACKYPSSEKKLDKRITEGYEQLERHGVAGLVVVGMDILCCRGMKKFVQFPDSKEAILGSMTSELKQWVTKAISRREGVKGVKNRKPLNGAMFTLSMAGVFGKPAGLTVASQVTFQSQHDNPLNPDIEIIANAIGRLGS